MEKCHQCNRKFPSHLIAPMMIDSSTFMACPICALAIRNEMHGLPPDTPFQGEIAGAMYHEAVEFLKPKVGKK